MKDTPNVDPNKSSSLGYNVRFWAGVVVGYEHQKEQLESGNGWRYKVRVLGEHSDKDQNDDKDLDYADVLLSTSCGSGAAYKLRSARISQGDTVYGIKGPNIPTMIIGVEPRKRSTILQGSGKFKTLSGFYGSLVKNNILSGEFNEQLGPATPGGRPYTKPKSERDAANDKLSEIGIDPNEEGVVENVDEQITPPKEDVTKDWQPGDHLSKDKLFDIQEKTKNKESPGRVLFEAASQAVVQGIIEEETSKMLKAEANEIIKEEKVSNPTYTVAGVEYDTATGLPVQTYVDSEGNEVNLEDLRNDTSNGEPMGTFDDQGNYYPPGFEPENLIRTDEIETDEGTFRNGTYFPPGFEDATTIDYDNLA